MTNLETNETKMNSNDKIAKLDQLYQYREFYMKRTSWIRDFSAPIHSELRCKNLSKESKKLGAAGSGL